MSDAFAVHTYAAAKRRPRGPQRNGQVITQTVNRAVLSAALRIADGDASCLRIVSPTEVIVTNRGRR